MHGPTALSPAGGPRLVVPLFVTTSKSAHTEGQPWIALGALAPDARLDGSYDADTFKCNNSFSSCESEPMCSMEKATDASPTRAPILGRSKRREVCSNDASNLFPFLLSMSKATSAVSV